MITLYIKHSKNTNLVVYKEQHYFQNNSKIRDNNEKLIKREICVIKKLCYQNYVLVMVRSYIFPKVVTELFTL